MTQQIPGDVTIKTLSIFSNGNIVNLTELIQHISIYESILTPGIMAEIALSDTRNLLYNLPVLGGERLRLELASPGRDTIKYDFLVAEIRDASVSSNMKSKTYIIEAVTPEVLVDKTTKITKSYNTNISNIVQDVVKTFLRSKKNIEAQTTRGVQKIIISSMRPFDAVKMLRKRSMSSEDKSSMYVFFENKDGYHFKTVEKLLSQSDVGDRIFFEDKTLKTDIKNSGFRNIIAREEPQQFDMTKRMNTGGLAHDVKQFDVKTLNYVVKTSKFKADDYKSADGTLKNPYSQDFIDRYGASAGTNSWVYKDTGNPDTFISDGLGARQNIGALLGQGTIHLEVFGDSSLSAGQAIQLDLLENAAITSVNRQNPQLSGKYVIAFLRHIILPEGNMPRYTCSMEVIKGGYKSKV